MADEKSLVPIFSVPDIRTMAEVAYESRLFGVQSVEQAMALMLLSNAKGIHPMLASERYYIVDGRPAMKAETMLAEFMRMGGKIEWHERTDTCAKATGIHPQGGTLTIEWTIEQARTAGLVKEKGAWVKYPRQMLHARVVSELVRSLFPEVVLGTYTPEEIHDFAPVKNSKNEDFIQPAPFKPQTEEEIKMFGKWKVVDGDYVRDEKGNFIREDDDVIDLNGKDVLELKPEPEGEKENGS